MNNPLPPSGPDCARFADLLPLSAQHLLTEAQAERLQTHVQSCSHCQAKLELYARLDDAVRSYAGIGTSLPNMSGRIQRKIMDNEILLHKPATSQRRESPIAVVATLVAILIVGLFATVLVIHLPAIGLNIGGRSTVTSSNVKISLTTLDMVTPQDGWAAGTVMRYPNNLAGPGQPTTPPPQASFFLHYNGTTWQEVPLANDTYIIGISMVSANQGLALANDRMGGYEILSYQQGQWQVVSHFAPLDGRDYTLRAIAMADPNTGWIVGTSSSPTGKYDGQPALFKYSQGQWSTVPLNDPDAYELNAITMYSPTEGWAVGSANFANNDRSAYILHYQNGVWTRTGIGQLGLLYAVAEAAPGDVWAVGSETPTQNSDVLHYQADTWKLVTVPTQNILHAVAFFDPNDGWIGGDGSVLLHTDGSSWSNTSIVRHSFSIAQICPTSADEAWAIGSYDFFGTGTKTDFTISLLHYSAGSWQVYPLSGIIAIP